MVDAGNKGFRWRAWNESFTGWKYGIWEFINIGDVL